jgi:hypothetical protein
MPAAPKAALPPCFNPTRPLRSQVAHWINVPGNPGSPAWWPKEGEGNNLTSYRLYFPMTMNTNK